MNYTISIEILPSFRAEAVEDGDVTFNQNQHKAQVKCYYNLGNML